MDEWLGKEEHDEDGSFLYRPDVSDKTKGCKK